MKIKISNGNTIFLAFLVLFPIFMSPFILVKGDRNSNSNGQMSQAAANNSYFAKIPSNPNVYDEVTTYSDRNLTKASDEIKPDSKISIQKIETNDKGIPVFKFTNGFYAKASHKQFYDDKQLSRQKLSKAKNYWTSEKVTVFDRPYVVGVKPKKSAVTTYSKIQVTEKATTNHGTYFLVKGQGWIDAKTLSDKDERINKVQNILNQKYNDADKYSIYVKQLDTEKTAEINGDKVMYSASVSKLPLLYYVQEQLDEGKIETSKTFTYASAVNNFKRAYKPEGSGDISKTSNNQKYSVGELVQAVAQHSDNVATNILGYYVANQYDSNFQKSIKDAIGSNWDMKERKVSAKTAGLMMEAIYQQNGDITNYLSSTEFDNQRIAKNIPVKVAHKIGDAYDYRHDVAIVYADSPFIISVFTENASYDDITVIADDVYKILK
ncbi:serine hydrolase [Streptococcus dentapri]|uniref:Serine hydrolase n=1 Tax=Streptococcus dentapri TaxID=573564 RepID=A0ABV8D256_9STRE